MCTYIYIYIYIYTDFIDVTCHSELGFLFWYVITGSVEEHTVPYRTHVVACKMSALKMKVTRFASASLTTYQTTRCNKSVDSNQIFYIARTPILMPLKSFNRLLQTKVAREKHIENNGTAQMFCSVIDLIQLTNPKRGTGCVRSNDVMHENCVYSLRP